MNFPYQDQGRGRQIVKTSLYKSKIFFHLLNLKDLVPFSSLRPIVPILITLYNITAINELFSEFSFSTDLLK